MPHLRQPPSDIPSILATGNPDPEWSAALETSPVPAGADYGPDPVAAMSLVKRMNKAAYPRQRAALNASRPANVVETEVNVCVDAACQIENRVILCYPAIDSTSKFEPSPSSEPVETPRWPLIVLFHGGGHCFGFPEMELPLARLLVQHYSAIVVLPSYRLAPESPFPTSFRDCFAVIDKIALDIINYGMLSSKDGLANLESHLQLLPAALIPNISELFVGGNSAGATIAESVAHLYDGHRASNPNVKYPPITGLFLSCGGLVNGHSVPSRYESFYLSQKQNRDCVPIDADFYKMVFANWKPDYDSKVLKSLSERTVPAKDYYWIKNDHVRVYLQACGMDLNRDDTLIYERMLREELGIETRLDMYAGFGHCFWGMSGIYADLEMTKQRTAHTIEGIGWLLRRN